MPKPKGTTGATKMKIMAVICHNCELGLDSHGYNVWQALKSNFHIYLNDRDVHNVYHHLKDLCALGMLVREETLDAVSNRYPYHLTEKGLSLRDRYEPYLSIVRRNAGLP